MNFKELKQKVAQEGSCLVAFSSLTPTLEARLAAESLKAREMVYKNQKIFQITSHKTSSNESLFKSGEEGSNLRLVMDVKSIGSKLFTHQTAVLAEINKNDLINESFKLIKKDFLSKDIISIEIISAEITLEVNDYDYSIQVDFKVQFSTLWPEPGIGRVALMNRLAEALDTRMKKYTDNEIWISATA